MRWNVEARGDTVIAMCRNIRVLLNFEPPTTEDEIRAAALQYVRKVSGTRAPSKANQERFDRAVDQIADATRTLLSTFVVHTPPRTRDDEIRKARQRALERFGPRPARDDGAEDDHDDAAEADPA